MLRFGDYSALSVAALVVAACLTLLPLLARAIQEGQLEIVRMSLGGPNAADFGLVSLRGAAVASATAGDHEARLSQYVKMHLLSGNGRPGRRSTLHRCSTTSVAEEQGQPGRGAPSHASDWLITVGYR